MPSKKAISSKSALPYKSANKDRRKDFHIKQKKARDSIKREERFARKKLEDKNPELKEARLKANVPITIESKRKWDEEGEEGDNILGLAVDLGALAKRRKLEELEELERDAEHVDEESAEQVDEDREADDVLVKEGEEDTDSDSMLGESDEEDEDQDVFKKPALPTKRRAASPNPSTTSTRTDLTPEALAAKFPSLFAEPTTEPKVLITTSINSTLHEEATLLEDVFPNSVYVRRSAHRFGHKFSVKEIAKFASNRNFTTSKVLFNPYKTLI
jgi:ribosome production factor 1